MEFILGEYGVRNIYVLALIIPLSALLYISLAKGAMNRKKIVFLLSRMIIGSLLIIALSEPFSLEAKTTQEAVTLVSILSDSSDSMRLSGDMGAYADTLYNNLSTFLENRSPQLSETELKFFSEGNRTGIGDILYQSSIANPGDEKLIILLSDGVENQGRDSQDMAKVLAGMNITVLTVTPPEEQQEIYISDMIADKKTPLDADYSITLTVGIAGSSPARYDLHVKLNNQEVTSITNAMQTEAYRSYKVTTTVGTEGISTIEAWITPRTEDFFEFNNRITRTVEVVEKPKVLLVSDSKRSRLEAILEGTYDLTVTREVPDGFSEFSATYFDNIPEEYISSDAVNSLSQYLLDGNGLVVVGGEEAYEKGNYYSSQFETLLPVISTKPPEKKRNEISVVFLIDVSESTSYGLAGNRKVDVEKAIALNMLRQLDDNDTVSAIAFNMNAFLISPPATVRDVRSELSSKIRSLDFSGGTDMTDAINQADKLLEGYSGKKYVVLLSDGVIKKFSNEKVMEEKVASMREKGIITYTVGVGFDTREPFMQALADAGGGLYFSPENYERLKLEFDTKGKEDKDIYTISAINQNHYITKDLEDYSKKITNFNGVNKKSIAQVLMRDEGKMPILTTWRFGLGRVVSFTIDNGNSWAPKVYDDNPEIVSSITNWVIGDLEKNKKINIESYDCQVGEKAEFTVKSDIRPQITVRSESGDLLNVSLKQTDVNRFTGSFTPNSQGTYTIRAQSSQGNDIAAVYADMPAEYRSLGVDSDKLTQISQTTWGQSYSIDETDMLFEDTLKYIRDRSERESIEKTPIREYFMAGGLGLFFIDVVMRRLSRILRRNRNKI